MNNKDTCPHKWVYKTNYTRGTPEYVLACKYCKARYDREIHGKLSKYKVKIEDLEIEE